MKALSCAGLVLSVMLSACGSGHAEKPLTRSQFTARSNAICAASVQRIRTIGQSSHSLRKQLDALVTETSRRGQELRALRPPAEIRAGFDAWLGALQVENSAYSRLASLARAATTTIPAGSDPARDYDSAQRREARLAVRIPLGRQCVPRHRFELGPARH